MIDLNREVTAKKQEDFDDLPAGKYTVEVAEVADWEEKQVKNAQINARDEEGNIVKNDKGKIVKEIVPNLIYHTAKVKLRVTVGEFAKRIITTFLTTHPDAMFITEGFLYAVDETQMKLSDMQTKLKGKDLIVDLDYREYNKTITDKDTGIDHVEVRKMPNVKKFIRILF